MPTSTLLPDLQRLLKKLEDDLRRRSDGEAEIQARLRTQYDAAKAAQRTAAAFSVWRDELVTQIGVAWILGCVFVRFLEDNDFLDQPLISGPGDRRKRAEEQTDEYFRAHPIDSETNYLEHVFRTVRELPSMDGLIDERHNPLWQFSPSGDMGRELLRFWRTVDPDSGVLKYEFGKGATLGGGELKGSPPGETPGSTAGETPAATDEGDSTRFLGDLYQDLSEAARKRFALLQTPIFVEEFILDRTLDPAIATFGLATVRMIDPTCGSGHFLLGAFHRLLGRWQRQEPGTPVRELVQRALDAVHGVDLNPFAVAVARFRLLIAALGACEITRLRHAPAFRIHVAAGDSLLHGPGYEFLPGGVGVVSHHYEVEDLAELQRLLGQRYHAVVGNPPYITVKDKALNQLYRERFGSCHRKYSLAAPFMELFFYLALRGDGTPAKPAGQVGMITANSFMKREFGKKLIETFLPGWDLTHVIDTSGAYIPGHGTPTVILFGKNQSPVASTIRAVMGIKGEPTTPEDPAHGQVWTAIVTQLDQPGSQSEFVSVGDTVRESFHRHPWSIGGGGAAELKEVLDEAGSNKLGDLIDDAGFMAITGEDEAFIGTPETWRRIQMFSRDFVKGEAIRDWCSSTDNAVAFAYEETANGIKSRRVEELRQFNELFWPLRTALSERKMFGKHPRDIGIAWNEFIVFQKPRYYSRCLLSFAFAATCNHFVIQQGGRVLDQSAPVMQLRADLSDRSVYSVLGILNSSCVGFWMRQVCYNNGRPGADSAGADEPFEHRYQFDNTKLSALPIPKAPGFSLTKDILAGVDGFIGALPGYVLSGWAFRDVASSDLDERLILSELMQFAREQGLIQLRKSIALQEELDWECYRLYGLIEDDLTLPVDQVPGIRLGERAFEIVLARRMAAREETTEWFARHDSTPITEIPTHWPEPYRKLVERRIQVIQDNANIRLIERPEYKRRWKVEPWDEQLVRALREWLLKRLEMYFFGGGRMVEGASQKNQPLDLDAARGGLPPLPPGEGRGEGNPTQAATVTHDPVATLRAGWPGGAQPAVVSTHRLAECARADADFMQVAELYRKRPDFDVAALVAELVEDESVPFLPAQRYKESGLRHRLVWEDVWDLQRREDVVEAEVRASRPTDDEKALTAQIRQRQREVVGEIPVPPKYKSADFKKTSYWRLRGKLDVPKERWVSFPGCERESDPSLPIAWAGWDHLQQAQALAAYLEDLKGSGASDAKQLLVLAGLQQLVPWLLQWHNDVHPDFGMRLGDYFRDHVRDELQRLGKTDADLRGLAYGPGV